MVLFGSPHQDGVTSRMLQLLLAKSPQSAKVDIINAYQMQVKPCVDCGYCKSHIGCLMEDFHTIDALLRQSDVIIVATPVYYLSFPAPLKAIFDRFQLYYSARFDQGIKPVMQKSKVGGLMVCSGSKKMDGVEIIKKQVEMAFSLLNCRLVAEVAVMDTDSGVDEAALTHKIDEFTNNMMIKN